MPSHLVKTPAGAALRFQAEGYPERLLKAFLAAARDDHGLTPAALAKAEAILLPALDWPLIEGGSEPKRGLMLPCAADKRSSKGHVVDGLRMEEDAAKALAFHQGRSWLNAQAKARGWITFGARALELDARFARALSLAKGMVVEDAREASLYGSQRSFALFIGPGYVEAKGSAVLEDAPLSRAKLFESAAEARQFASRKRMLKMVSVVEVAIRAARVVSFADNGSSQDRLLAAIAQAEAAELKALLREREAQELREKIASLEATQREQAEASGAAPSPEAPRGRSRL